MTRKRRITRLHMLLAALGLAGGMALVLAGVWWFGKFERVRKEVPLPPRGEAVYNPLYALKRTLQLAGIAVQSRPRLQLDTAPLGPHDTLVLRGDVQMLGAEESDSLVSWVANGGHLVIGLPARRPSRLSGQPVNDVLGLFNLHTVAGEYACHVLQTSPQDRMDMCGRTTLAPDPKHPPEAAWSTANGQVPYARAGFQEGTVDAMTDLDVLGNDALEDPANAQFARQVLAPGYGRGTVHLVYAEAIPSIWRMLLQRGWPAWVPALLALLGWMCLRSQRVGPWRPSPTLDRRSLLEHVQASGELLHRHGQGRLLHAALLDRFETDLRRRAPRLAAMHAADRVQALATHTGLPPADVQAALQPPAGARPAELHHRITLLNRLRRQL